MMGLQVENLVLNNTNPLHKMLGIYPDEIVNEGPFFQKRTARNKGCQIDYLIQGKFGVLYLCEIKFTTKLIRTNIIDEIQTKIDRLSLPRNFSIRPVLIHAGEVCEKVEDAHYFSRIIDIYDLFDEQ